MPQKAVGGKEGPRQPLLVSPCQAVAADVPGGPGTSEHEGAVPSGEISIRSTHAGGMSKLSSSSSLPCRERWRAGRGEAPIRAGSWSRSYSQSLCLTPRAKPGWSQRSEGCDPRRRKGRSSWYSPGARRGQPRPCPARPTFPPSAEAGRKATGPLPESGGPKPHPPSNAKLRAPGQGPQLEPQFSNCKPNLLGR